MKYFLTFLLLFVTSAHANTWQVGPTRQYTVPSAVMPLIADGDTVLIDSGAYVGDVGVWTNNDLVIRCPNGMARFNANGNIAQKKGIWVLAGNNTYVEGFEFYGAAISLADGDNGAGIRVGGNGVTCRRCYFHDNQEGILTGNDTVNNNIWIEACEFDHNGVETGSLAGYEHNIYVGHSTSCTIKFCYFHASIIGHEIKTRANVNYILYNKIVDGPTGDGSYSIDIPNGGLSFVIGNSIEKGPMASNSTVITYGEEGIVNPDSEFYFVNNTVVTDLNSTIFLNIQPGTNPALIANNIFAGPGHPLPAPDTVGNIESTDISYFHFANPANYNYHITDIFIGFYSAHFYSPIHGFSLTPVSEYVDPMDSTLRPVINEIGAFVNVFSPRPDSMRILKNFQSITCSGETDTEIITFTNTDTISFIFNATISGFNASDFSIVGGSKSLRAGDIDTLFVIFTPTSGGVETTELMYSGGPFGGIISLGASGGSALISGSVTAPLTPVGQTSPPFPLMICNSGLCPCTPGIPSIDLQFTYISGGTSLIGAGECDTLLFTFTPSVTGNSTYPVIFPMLTGTALSTIVTITATAFSEVVTKLGTSSNAPIERNYPNPFTTETIIPLSLSTIGNLALFNECGTKMNVTYTQTQNGIVIERGNLPTGIYFYRISEAERGTIAEGSMVIGN